MNPNKFYPDVEFVTEASVFEFVKNRCLEFGNDVAVVEAATGKEWTFCTVLARVCQLRDFFRKHGVRAGDRVALYAFNVLELYASVWALASVSAVAVLIRPIFKYREVKSFLEISKSTTVVTDEMHLSTVISIQQTVPTLKTVLLTGESKYSFPSIAELFRSNPQGSHFESNSRDCSDDTVFMIPTSGTLGNSKLVEHTHRSFLSSFYITETHVRMLHKNDVVLLSSSISHVTGLWALGGCMHQGIKCVIPRLAKMPNFDDFRDSCNQFHVTTFLTFPTLTRRILLHATGDPIFSVSNIMCGGSRNLPVMGQTELMVSVSITPENEFDLETIGHPPSNCAIRILNLDTGEMSGIGEVGEIVVRSPCIMKGYFLDPVETKAAFTEDGWMRTGDLGYLDPDRMRYCFVNRLREVITCGDNRLYPAELERVLTEHPSVCDAAVIGVPHPDLGEAPAALIELRPNTQATDELRLELGSLIENQFATYKKLHGGVHFVESLPRSDLNKVIRRKLKELLSDRIF